MPCTSFTICGRDESMAKKQQYPREFFQSLASEIATVHKEENALCTGVFDQPVNEIARCVRLAAAAGHLDECSRTALGEGCFQISDGRDLCGTQALSREFREGSQPGAKRRPGMLKLLREPLIESFRTVKAEYSPAPCIRFKQVGEPGFYACALVLEWQRPSSRGVVR